LSQTQRFLKHHTVKYQSKAGFSEVYPGKTLRILCFAGHVRSFTARETH